MRSFCVCKSSDCCGKKITCGYVSANETGLYYLQSRYYSPEVGRFINADSYASTGQRLLGNNMFAYCLNNPVNFCDPTGEFGLGTWLAAVASTNPVGIAVLATVVVVGVVAAGVIVYNQQKKKPINLPSWKRLNIDMDHILSGHSPGGNRNPNGNKSVFWGMTAEQILRAIREAYEVAEKVQTQGNSVKLQGFSETFGIWIEMWVDIVDKILKTAYPFS